jgi:hypothetical protein
MPRSFSWGATPLHDGNSYQRISRGTLLVSKRSDKYRWPRPFIYKRGNGPSFRTVKWNSVALYLSRRGPVLSILFEGDVWSANARDWAIPRQNKSKKAQK